MAITTYSENLEIQYKAVSLFSKAGIFNLIILLLAIILPYLLAYRSQGFWTKLELVREQPNVQFDHQALIILETSKNPKWNEDIVWSTFPGLTKLLANQQHDPFILSQEFDVNNDGLYDWLELSFDIPLLKKVDVTGIHVFLLFDYKLFKFANLKMKSLGNIHYQSPRKGDMYELIADLGLVQKQPLWNQLRDERFNTEIIPPYGQNFEEYTTFTILSRYSNRNVSTTLKNKYEFWRYNPESKVSEQDEDDQFKIKIKINYSEQSYQIWAGFWQTMKWALIQYLALFIIVVSVLRKLQGIVYKAKIFEAFVELPWDTFKSKK